MQQENKETGREAVGVFSDIKSLNEAVAELEVTAFPRQDISVRNGTANEDGPESGVDEEDSPDTPRTILIRPEEKVLGAGVMVGGGVYAGAVTGVLTAGLTAPLGKLLAFGILGGFVGLMLGGIIAWLLGHYYNGILQKQIAEGRMILWVRTPNEEEENLACRIMKKHGGQRVHIHDIH